MKETQNRDFYLTIVFYYYFKIIFVPSFTTYHPNIKLFIQKKKYKKENKNKNKKTTTTKSLILFKI